MWKRRREQGRQVVESDLVVGARVVHSTFGAGTVTWAGVYKDVECTDIEFDSMHQRRLVNEYGIPCLRLERPEPTS